MKVSIFIKIIIVFLLLGSSIHSMASEENDHEGMNGRMLRSLCSDYLNASLTGELPKDSSKPFMRCEHYMQGLVETSEFYERMMYTVSGNHLFCFPKKKISTRQAILVINEYLKKHPEKLDTKGVVLVMESLLEAYPCNK